MQQQHNTVHNVHPMTHKSARTTSDYHMIRWSLCSSSHVEPWTIGRPTHTQLHIIHATVWFCDWCLLLQCRWWYDCPGYCCCTSNSAQPVRHYAQKLIIYCVWCGSHQLVCRHYICCVCSQPTATSSWSWRDSSAVILLLSDGWYRQLNDELHWLDVPQSNLKHGLITYHCLHWQAPWYLTAHITPDIKVASSHRLRSTIQHWLIVPHCWLNTYGHQARSLVRWSGIDSFEVL